MLKTSVLKPNYGAKKKAKVVGRGNSSGHGTYSTRGAKGQKARSGGSNRLKQKGMRALLLSLPKKRGFQSQYAKPAVVNLRDLEKRFNDGDKVTAEALREKRLVRSIDNGIKILGSGSISKKLELTGCTFSLSAKEAILKAGGTII